MLFDLQTRDFN